MEPAAEPLRAPLDRATQISKLGDLAADAGLWSSSSGASLGALEHAARFTWEATALGTLQVLDSDAIRRRGR